MSEDSDTEATWPTESLMTLFRSSAESAVEAVKAASELGLGVKLWNQDRVISVDGDTSEVMPEWIVEIYQHIPEVELPSA